jgi:hypothetical protein
VNDFALVVKTADRSPRKNYLRETLYNLARAGVWESTMLHSLHVVDTGGSPGFLEKEVFRLNDGSLWDDGSIVLHTQPEKLTLHQNAARCIRVASEQAAPWSMVVEDDVDFCDDFLGSVARWLHDVIKERGQSLMYVFGANYDQVGDLARAGKNSWSYPLKAFYGNQALVWKQKTAKALAEWLGPDPSYNGVRDHGHDLLLQRWGREMGAPHFVSSCPSFVQHIGNESGISNRFFHFASWPGRAWSYKGVA